MAKTLEVRKDRTKFSLVIGDELLEKFAEWAVERNGFLPDKSTVNTFVNWLGGTGHGSEAMRLITDAPRQLFLAFDYEKPPWRWVDGGEEQTA